MTALHSPWQSFVPRIDPRHRHWLVDAGSLTKKIKSCHADFSVIRVQQEHAALQQSEQYCLNLTRGQRILQRQVLLLSGDVPVVFAHTVTDLSRVRRDWHFFNTLGNKALGVTLFSNPMVYREGFEYTRLSSHDRLYQAASHALLNAGLPQELPSHLWARRCVFKQKNKMLSRMMVTEVMLPAIYELKP